MLCCGSATAQCSLYMSGGGAWSVPHCQTALCISNVQTLFCYETCPKLLTPPPLATYVQLPRHARTILHYCHHCVRMCAMVCECATNEDMQAQFFIASCRCAGPICAHSYTCASYITLSSLTHHVTLYRHATLKAQHAAAEQECDVLKAQVQEKDDEARHYARVSSCVVLYWSPPFAFWQCVGGTPGLTPCRPSP